MNKKNKKKKDIKEKDKSSDLKKDKKDSERKKKLLLLEQIDDLTVRENNNFMLGKFKDALKFAKEIIILAREAKINSIVQEQKEFIKQINSKIVEKNKKKILTDSFEVLRPNYDEALKNNNRVKAHRIIEQFRQKIDDISILNSLPLVKKLLSEESELWDEHLVQQEKVKTELKKLDNQFHGFLKKNDIEKTGEIIENAKKIIPELDEFDLKIIWESYEKEFLEQIRRNEIKIKIEKSIANSLEFKDKYSFKEGLSIIDSMIEQIKGEDLPEHQEKLLNTRKEIIAADIKYKKLYLEFAERKSKIRLNHDNKFYEAAISNCVNIIPISQQIGMYEEERKFKDLLEQLKQEFEINKSAILKEKEELIKNVSNYKDYIKFDEESPPIVEEFNVKDLLGDFSDVGQEKLEKVGSLLKEHRVIVNNRIISRTIYRSSSGEVFENEDERVVQKLEEEEYGNNYGYSSLKNRLDDTIENVIITDIIPYNFEILGIELNGERVERIPHKNRRKAGLEIKWEIGSLAPNERVEISYHLQHRVSRTILFILNDLLKIVRTHSGLNKLDREGLFEAKLPFTKLVDMKMNSIVIEDIIPNDYILFIEEPRNILPEIDNGSDSYTLKWKIGNLNDGTLNFHYKLLEMNRYEEIKISINELNSEGLNNLNDGNLLGVLSKFKEIRNLLNNNFK